MKRPLRILFSGIVFASVIAGAVTFSMQKLMQPKIASSSAAAPSKEVVSASVKAPPTIVGTDHPVPVTSPSQPPADRRLSDQGFLAKRETASPKSKALNPPATPVPQASAVVKDASVHQAESLSDSASRHEGESPVELVREKAEQARERAERLRARIEDLYQSHQISESAYRQGQAQYQQELAKYEDQIAKLHLSPETGPTND